MNLWIAKAIIQKAVSFMPGGPHINHFFQVASGRFGLTDQEFQDRLDHLHPHLRHYRELSGRTMPDRVLELGTGWFPVVPIGLYLSGAGIIVSTDIRNHLRSKYLLQTILKFIEWDEKGTLRATLPSLNPGRMDHLKKFLANRGKKSLQRYLHALPLEFHSGPLGQLMDRKGHFQLIVSNNTLEHIPELMLKRVLEDLAVLGGPAAISSHFIDMSDHFSHVDPSISPYHFLKFSPRAWAWIDNSIQPQNRLRITTFRAFFREIGYTIAFETHREGSLEEVQKIKIYRTFQALPLEDLRVTHAYLAVKHPGFKGGLHNQEHPRINQVPG